MLYILHYINKMGAIGRFTVMFLIFHNILRGSESRMRGPEGVRRLIGDPDFRDVYLSWEYDPTSECSTDSPESRSCTFQIYYCELQAWGQHRCQTKIVDVVDESTNQTPVSKWTNKHGRSFSAQVGSLRMATTYSFEVRPYNFILSKEARSVGKSIIVPTKGFSARATQCLPHASEVEVSTGPYFGGRIFVEATDRLDNTLVERCSIYGDASSARDSYTLRIDHEECGSEVNDTTVATYVIVQESLPILTHSTRRFLVLCTYKPETLTVRAGINLPSGNTGANLQYYKPHTGSAIPYEGANEIDDVQPARFEAQIPENSESGVAGEIVLVVFLVLAGVVAIGLLVYRISSRLPSNFDVTSAQGCNSRNGDDCLCNSVREGSESGSIYSISLSESDYDTPNNDRNRENATDA